MSDVRLSIGAQPTLHVDVDEVITVSAHMGGEVFSPPPYTGATTVTPSLTEQVLPTAGTAVASDITVEAVQSGGVTMRKPTLDNASGEVRSKADVATGWVTGGAYTGSALTLDKQAGTTVTPTESEQIAVAQYRWTTGEVKVAGIPSDYVGSAVERRDETDLTASGATVTVPSGYYAETEAKDVASGSVSVNQPDFTASTGAYRSRATVSPGYTSMSGAYMSSWKYLTTQAASTVTPTESEQTAVPQYRWTTGDVKVGAISSTYVGSGVDRRDSTDLTASGDTVTVPAGYYESVASKAVPHGSAATPATTVTANPTVSVDGAGLITATVSASQSVTPTVSAGYVASGTAGTVTVTGSATEQLTVRDSSDMTVTYNAVTAPAGYYPSAATKSVQNGSATASAQKSLNGHTATVTPKVTKSEGYITSGSSNGTAVTVSVNELVSGTLAIDSSGTKDVTNYASASVAAGSATMPASASGHGTIAGALNNTMNVIGTVTATPDVTAGYVASGTSGSTSISLQAPVTTLNTATWTPTTADQTIPAGCYTIGTQTIKGDANLLAENIAEGISLFNIVGTCPTFDALSWLGQEAELIATYAKETTQLSSTSFNGWTPSTTAKTIKSGSSLTATAVDMGEYDYILRWQFFCEPVYSGSETNTARMVKTAQEIYQGIFRRPNSLANIATLTDAGNACQTINTPSLMEYWNNNSSHTFTWSASYGIYAAATAATFASSTNLQTNLTPKRPSISARCSTTYQSTSNMGKITQASTYFYTQGWLYRVRKGKSLGYNQYRNVCTVFNDGI